MTCRRRTSRSRAWCEALEAGGIYYRLSRIPVKKLALRALVEVLPLPDGCRSRNALAALAGQGGIGEHGDRRRHRGPACPQPDRPACRAADGHALLPGTARRLRGAGWKAGARAVFHDLPDECAATSDTFAAVLRPARREVQGGRDAAGSPRERSCGRRRASRRRWPRRRRQAGR